MSFFKDALKELDHLCQTARALLVLGRQAAKNLKEARVYLERIDGRLDRLELYLARHTDYPTSQTSMPDLAELRERIPE